MLTGIQKTSLMTGNGQFAFARPSAALSAVHRRPRERKRALKDLRAWREKHIEIMLRRQEIDSSTYEMKRTSEPISSEFIFTVALAFFFFFCFFFFFWEKFKKTTKKKWGYT